MAEKNNSSHVYFPGLGALRFLAAAVVFFSHIELFRQRAGLEHHYDHVFVSEAGRLAVTFFFVLSGFLITYLLLREQGRTGTVSAGKFYIRRILRIWPAYFLVLGLCFFVLPPLVGVLGLKEAELPAAHFPQNLLLFLFFLPNLAISIYPPVALAEPLWSIGVEEQFYLVWPWLVRGLKKMLPYFLLALIVALPLLRLWLGHLCLTATDASEYALRAKFFSFFYYFRIDSMAMGGLAAWLLYKERFLSRLFHPLVQLLAVAGLVVLLLLMTAPVYEHIFFAACFALLVLNIAANPRSLLRLRFKAGDVLGNCSYSFYLFHELVIALGIWFFRDIVKADLNDGTTEILLTLVSFLATLGLSWLSWHYLEAFFLRRKKRWQVVESRSNSTW